MLDFFRDNALIMLGVFSAGFIGVGIANVIASVIKFLINSKINKLIVKFIPEGIALGDILKGEKPNEERLYQAVITVENRVLNTLPKSLREYADKLIDSRRIAKQIERELNKDKYEGLAKPTIEWN